MTRRVVTTLAALSVGAALASTAVVPGFAFGRYSLHRSAPSRGTLVCTQPVVVNGVTLKGDCYTTAVR